MHVLALDTTQANCSAALRIEDGGEVREIVRAQAMERGHAEALMPMVAEVMVEAGLTFEALDRIGVTVGPGTFTGVRVGIAAARGLGIASGALTVGIGTLATLANPVAGDVVAAIDARRGDLYVQGFGAAEKLIPEPSKLTPAEAARRLGALAVDVVGSGTTLLLNALGDNDMNVARAAAAASLPDARHVASLAAGAIVPAEAPPPSPLYLRAPDAKLPRRRPLLYDEAGPAQ